MNTPEYCQAQTAPGNLVLVSEKRTPFFQPENRASYVALCLLLWSTLSYILITHFILRTVEIKGASMSPALLDGQKYILYKFHYLFRSPLKGEIVVIRDPEDHGLSIKRIIGVPHETFEIRRDGVYINGAKFDEPYLSQESRFAAGHKLVKPTQLGENQFYVLGDNRDYSADSRIYGPVPKDAILGHLASR